MKKISIFLLLLAATWLSAQQSNPVQLAKDALEGQKANWQLNDEDLKGLLISDQYVTEHNGVTHVYLQQTVNGIPIHNAVTSVHINNDGKAYVSKNRFYSNAAALTNGTTSTLSEGEAVSVAAKERGIAAPQLVEKSSLAERGETSVVFEPTNISNSEIKVRPTYFYDNGQLKLSWDLAIDDKNSPDYMSYKVDAQSGEIVDMHNWTVYCQVGHVHKGCGHLRKNMEPVMHPIEEVESGASGTYRVFPLPAESPNHGSHDLISSPHIAEASPHGWHDVNGDGNADYTITRGNNVHAFAAPNDETDSPGNEPDGGVGLNFDFNFEPNSNPLNSADAATTNLFYVNNMMHDICYLFGFDEESGNFQANNFNKGGAQNDFVVARALAGANIDNNEFRNNASFGTPADGSSGRMQMFVWNSGGEVFQVLEPTPIAGRYESREADFGPNISFDNLEIQAEIVEAYDDNPNNPSFCCGDVINDEELDGKIAIVDRGGCDFVLKVRNCEAAGAIAVIVCTFDESLITMGSNGNLADPDIPSIMIGSRDCQKIRAFAGRGAIGRLKASETNLQSLDGDYDNGIIAHEYGHGVSNRLTGGPSLAGCLGNQEQMGEGWSDFFSLILTVEEGDQGSDPRGIGTYAQRQPTNGAGIRPRPYTTDMSINELTYKSIDTENLSIPHGLGSVWCTMLWDLYWAFVDTYGYDGDWMNKNAGNNIAIQLVMDGMKLQACSPGFVDGRDAILQADTINNNGENGCLIWDVFARRGLGYYADQGSTNNAQDGKENFEPGPLCQNKIRLTKSAVNIIDAGDEIEYTILVENNKSEESKNVNVTDFIPENCTYIMGSANIPATVNGNEINFDLGNMSSLEKQEIIYKVKSSPNGSATLWLDDFENGEDNWDIAVDKGFTIWYLQDEYVNSGEAAFFTENQNDDADSYVYQFDPLLIDLENPALRFFHWYSTSTEDNTDGGIVEISVNGQPYQFISPLKMLRNGYEGGLPYGTFVLPRLSGFYGDSEGFIDTYVDLEEYKGQEVQIRFRFGTEEGGVRAGDLPIPAGWVVDDVEYIDLLFYNSEVCVTDDSGAKECTSLPGKGTLVTPNYKVNNDDLPEDVEQWIMYPNPAQDVLKLKLDMTQRQDARVRILSTDGRMVQKLNIPLRVGTQIVEIPVQELTTGTYILEVQSGAGTISETWIKL